MATGLPTCQTSCAVAGCRRLGNDEELKPVAFSSRMGRRRVQINLNLPPKTGPLTKRTCFTLRVGR